MNESKIIRLTNNSWSRQEFQFQRREYPNSREFYENRNQIQMGGYRPFNPRPVRPPARDYNNRYNDHRDYREFH